MKRLLIKIYSFLTGTNFWKYVLFFAAYAIAFAVLMSVLADDVLTTILGTIIGLISSGMFVYLVKIFFSSLEDYAKVSRDTKYLKTIYTNKEDHKRVELNGTSFEVVYHDLLTNVGQELDAVYDHDKVYEAPGFVENNYIQLLQAHGRSAKINCDTIRLDDIREEDGKQVFYMSRSNFYNHLATNRAVDFELADGITVRSVFEYGPQVTPLKESKLSNHLGVNGLVFLSDGTILLPRRKGNSTISKNMITSSIAVRLCHPKNGAPVDKHHVFHGTIEENLTARLKISPEDVATLEKEIHFIGIGQNIYEGGKPQMYYVVFIKNLDKRGYLEMKARSHEGAGRIDVDKLIYLADYSTLKFSSHERMHVEHFDPKKGKNKSVEVGFERSFACNLWHYEEWKRRNGR